MHEPRGTQRLLRRRTKVRIPCQHPRHKRHSMDTRLALQRAQRHRFMLTEEPLVLTLGEPGPSTFPEGMHLGEHLVEDDPKSPHVDFGIVAVRQLVVVVQQAPHLRRDVRKRADLCAKAVVFEEEFGVVEVAELHADWQCGRDEDVLMVR